MQIGRWNHQSSDGRSGASRPVKSPSHGVERSYSPRPSSGRGTSRRYGERSERAPQRGGFGGRGRGPARGRGFGAFGETEAEISKFMNKTVVTTEEPVLTRSSFRLPVLRGAKTVLFLRIPSQQNSGRNSLPKRGWR
jgi:hypothetical protein